MGHFFYFKNKLHHHMWRTRVLPREFREEVARRKITFASEANIGFLSSVFIPNFRQARLEHFSVSDHKSENDSSDLDVCSGIFSDKSNLEDACLSRLIYETFHSAAIWRYKEYQQHNSNKIRTVFLPKYDCSQKLHGTFRSLAYIY